MNNSYITIIKEKRTVLSRKRVPLNQNECTADFRIGVPFEQNLHSYQKVSENMRLIGVNYIEEAGIPIVGQDEIAECYDKALMWFVSAYGQAIYELETGQCGTGTEQTEALRGQISDVYTYFSDGENEEKAVLARDMLKAIEAWEAIY